MAIESAADRLALLSADDFGTAATIGAATVYGIFDDAATTVALETGEAADTAPQFHAQSADLSGVAVGTAVVVTGTAYKVTAIQPDGTGMTTLILSKD